MISPTSSKPFNDYRAEDWEAILPYLTKDEREFVERVVFSKMEIWEPLPGPQTMALQSLADVIGYGGAAGGGKTDLLCGKMLTQHTRGLIIRREGTQLTGITDRFTEIIGNADGFNSQKGIWRLSRHFKARARQIEFGSTPHVDDWNKYQGRPHDFLGVDEAANFLEIQVRSLIGWVRSVDKKQRCQTLLTFNPPTTIEGRWIVEYFAPWLDDKHKNPAAPGELRYFATINGKEVEVPDTRRFVLFQGEPLYDFDPTEYLPTEIITPMSRTFIPSRITDNPYLLGTGYMAQLQALPEPLRSQMLNGDFKAGMTEDPWQVLPTAWVDMAMARWKPRDVKGEMLSLGCDVARGGKDKTVIARRHKDKISGTDYWYDELIEYPGSETPNGPTVASYVIAASRDRTPQHIDVIGVGASPYDFLVQAQQPVIGVDVRTASLSTDKSGLLTFKNLRSELWWKFRELLDPTNNTGIALPPDNALRVELCTPKWKSVGREIVVQSREEIYEELKRSVDKAVAVIQAAIDTPKLEHVPGSGMRNGGHETYDPYKDI
jgi:hypothetical protein